MSRAPTSSQVLSVRSTDLQTPGCREPDLPRGNGGRDNKSLLASYEPSTSTCTKSWQTGCHSTVSAEGRQGHTCAKPYWNYDPVPGRGNGPSGEPRPRSHRSDCSEDGDPGLPPCSLPGPGLTSLATPWAMANSPTLSGPVSTLEKGEFEPGDQNTFR